MTDEELDRLEALAKAATPGPWHVVGNTVQSNGVFVMAGAHTWERRAHCDNELAAAARDAVPALVAEVWALRDGVGHLKADADRLRALLAEVTAERDQAAALAHQLTAERDAAAADAALVRADRAKCLADPRYLAQRLQALESRAWRCSTHPTATAPDWGCPDCVREMRGELGAAGTALVDRGVLRTLLERARQHVHSDALDLAAHGNVAAADEAWKLEKAIDCALGRPPAPEPTLDLFLHVKSPASD